MKSIVIRYRIPRGKFWIVYYVDDPDQAMRCGLQDSILYLLGRKIPFSVAIEDFKPPCVQSHR